MYEERPSRVPGGFTWHHMVTHAGPGRILPDGCLDLIWAGDRLIVAGPDTAAHVASRTPGASYWGVRFAPGTGPGVLGVPAHALRDQRVDLADLWPAAVVRRLSEEVAASADPGAGLERVALRRLRGGADPVMPHIACHLAAGVSVAAVSARSGWSERQLLRRCLDAFGYGPKTLARILRFQSALALARSGMPFAAVAATTGYADQGHLSRDVKALSGVPLTRLVE